MTSFLTDTDTINWQEFEELANKIYQDICKQDINFDAIIGIARGGMFLSTYLAYRLNIKQLYVINTQLYKDKELITPEILYYPNEIHLNNVLVVDDILDTGGTYNLLNDLLTSISDNFSWAVLLDKGQCNIDIEFVGLKLNQDLWVNFPWN